MWEPETRPSLLLRLQDPLDQQAWTQFMTIYEPLVLRMLQQRGLQEADARDVCQQVVLAVTQALGQWQPDGREASFRRWLFGIARKLALKLIESGAASIARTRRGVGGSDMFELLKSLPEPDRNSIAEFDDEYRTEIFAWAVDRIRGEFRETTWQAFWRTCVLNESIAEVADSLGMTVGNVYVARTRIIARLRRIVEKYENQHDL